MKLDISLEQDLQWREAELASLKRIAMVSSSDKVAYQALLRSMWALLYAHFEGFTKFCWDIVLDQIQSERIPAKDLTERFQLLALEPEFRTLKSKLDPCAILNFVQEKVPAAMEALAEFPEDSRLKTDSNLWPNVFERETAKLGIVCDGMDRHRTRINALVARRNGIAHGKSMTIAHLNEYREYEHATLCMMHELAIKILDVVERQSYRTMPANE